MTDDCVWSTTWKGPPKIQTTLRGAKHSKL